MVGHFLFSAKEGCVNERVAYHRLRETASVRLDVQARRHLDTAIQEWPNHVDDHGVVNVSGLSKRIWEDWFNLRRTKGSKTARIMFEVFQNRLLLFTIACGSRPIAQAMVKSSEFGGVWSTTH
jgi:hypothetical protein